MSIDKLKSKFFNGSFINDVKHYFSKINEIIDYLNDNPISGGGLSGLTTNKVLKAGSATTAVDSNITDDGSAFTVNYGGQDIFYADATEAFMGLSTSDFVDVISQRVEIKHQTEIKLNAPSVLKGGVEVATVNDILGGATGSFTTNDGKTITVTNGRITAIV